VSITVSKVLEDVKSLSAKERAFLARCLISSLEKTEDENIDGLWAEIAKKRYEALKNGTVKPLSWDEIKQQLTD